VFTRSVKNLDPNVGVPPSEEKKCCLTDGIQYLARFKAVRERFDPQGIYRNVIGDILGLY
jgi:hypothetical protein